MFVYKNVNILILYNCLASFVETDNIYRNNL